MWASLRRASRENEQEEEFCSQLNVKQAMIEGLRAESSQADANFTTHKKEKPLLPRAKTDSNLALSPKNPWRDI